MKKIYAIVPARSGSKGVPHKNIRKLGGHSLIEWAIKSCKKSSFIDDIYLSSDSHAYCEEAINYGAKAPFLRPKEISNDLSTDFEMFIHALNWFKDNLEEPELFIHIRPTTPLRDHKIIDEAIRLFLEHPESTSLRSVHEMSESAYKTFEISSKSKLVPIFGSKFESDLVNQPRQTFPKTYVANGYVDIISPKHVRKYNSLHGTSIFPFITPTTHEIDNEYDFNYLNFLIKQDPNIIKKVFD